MDNEDDNVMLYSCGVQSELRTRKQFLVEMIKKHEAAMLELRDARIKCWKSMENVERYRLMTETYKSALQHKQHDKNVRTAALQVSRALLDKWKWKHKRHQSFFETKLQEEIKYREEIQKIAKDIETDILEMLDHSIRALMNQNKQSVSDKDISRLSQQLYYQTCRSYRFGITENEPCQKELVQKPTYETSFLNKTDIEKKVKGQVIPIDDKKKRGLFVKA